jgi:aminopeptidase-like protein
MIDDYSEKMYNWAKDLFPIHRSITGNGLRSTLNYIKEIIPKLQIKSVKSGYKAFDWIVPEEWEINDAYIADETGNKIVDYNENNLHIVGYSEPVDTWLSLEDLVPHLYSIKEQPDAIPYITSYYKKTWGFCLSYNQFSILKKGKYHIVIDSKFKKGVLNYGELIIKGSQKNEILLSTYVCHPSMANNELSGPVVTIALALWLLKQDAFNYTYRILFIPETIGSIVYLSKHYKYMKKNTIAGFVITCAGDEGKFSFLPSRKENTLADRVAMHILKYNTTSFKQYSFLERGSDERNYCSPLIDLPVVSIMKSKYETYPEYHTSLDNLSFITPNGLTETLMIYKKCISAIENNILFIATNYCEPQLGRRGLYPTLSKKNAYDDAKIYRNILAYADGKADLLSISDILEKSIEECLPYIQQLAKFKLIKEIKYGRNRSSI